MPSVLPKEGCRDRPVQDTIIVDFAQSIVSRMESMIHFLTRLDHDIAGEKTIKSPSEYAGGEFGVYLEVRDLI